MQDIMNQIRSLIDRQDNMAVIDKLYIPHPYSSRPAVKFVLGAELYLPNINRVELREKGIRFLSDYWKCFPEYINKILLRNRTRYIRFKGDPTDVIIKDCNKYLKDLGYGASLCSKHNMRPNDYINPYKAGIVISREKDFRPSSFEAYFPVCDEKTGIPNYQLLLEAILKWAEFCQPIHGLAGFSLTFDLVQDSVYALPIMKRFSGFNLIDDDFIFEIDNVYNRIKCVNWLTVLSTPLVDELGGIELMKNTLSLCKIHEYNGGVVIQAGEFPLLGDSHTGEIPEPYRQAAQYTKPIRFEEYDEGLFRVPRDMDAVTETLSWIKRFD